MNALAGAHYCAKHQGNASHYAEENCELCKAQAEIERLKTAACVVLNIVKHGRYPAVSLVDAFRAIDSLEKALSPNHQDPDLFTKRTTDD